MTGNQRGDEGDVRLPLGPEEGVLYRQVHPKLLKDGQPTSVNFRPTDQDEGKWSVDRSSVVSAEQSHTAYLERGLESIGVWGVSVDEVESTGRQAWADPIAPDPAAGEPGNEAHSFVDFEQLERKECEKVASLLKRAALARGRLYAPEPATP